MPASTNPRPRLQPRYAESILTRLASAEPDPRRHVSLRPPGDDHDVAADIVAVAEIISATMGTASERRTKGLGFHVLARDAPVATPSCNALTLAALERGKQDTTERRQTMRMFKKITFVLATVAPLAMSACTVGTSGAVGTGESSGYSPSVPTATDAQQSGSSVAPG